MKIYKYIFLLAFSIAFINCEDKIELDPHDSVSYEVAFTSPEDFTFALRGAYTGFRREGYYGGNSLLWGDILSDNVIVSSSGRNSFIDRHYFVLDANGTWDLLWTNAYVTIGRANLILENIDVLKEGAFKSQVKGEAMAIRALAHFDLVKVFGKAPRFATESDLGVPYVTSTDAGLKPARNPLAETYSLIEKDFVDAVDLLPEKGILGRIGKDAVNGLLSRLYLYMGEWKKSETAAIACIKVHNPEGLNDQATFPELWKDETEQGVVFKVKIKDVDRVSPGVFYSQTGLTGVRSEYVADFDFFSSFDVADIRRSVYVKTSVFDGKNWNHVAKHFGRATGNANVVDSKVLRLAEVYLNRAEAQAEGGDGVSALATLNELRTKRGLVAGAETGDALLTAIFDERRKELAFEGHRFWDLKRRNLPVIRSSSGDEANGEGTPVPLASRKLDGGHFKFTLPIPQDELNANANIVQNTGY